MDCWRERGTRGIRLGLEFDDAISPRWTTWGAFVISPTALTFAGRAGRTAGHLAPRKVTPAFVATTYPSATCSPSVDFPGTPVIRPTFLRGFRRRDEEGFSSCLARPCHRAAVSTSPERARRVNQHATTRTRLRPRDTASASGVSSRGDDGVHIRCGPR